MVYLNRITTKTGDDGSTGLGEGSRVPKTHPRIVAIGSVDELNATIGLALATTSPPESISEPLVQVQHDLFDAGAELCFPGPPADTPDRCGIHSDDVSRLDTWIAAASAQLSPLDSFVLPGGSPLAAALHLARTICRRTERDVLELNADEPVGVHLRTYLNRLSDLLFVYARLANAAGQDDVLWKPGRRQ